MYELDGDTLTIWSGGKGSPAYYRGAFSEDGNTLMGRWVWPGGGYESTSTRLLWLLARHNGERLLALKSVGKALPQAVAGQAVEVKAAKVADKEM